jgi:hypothetical protein
MRSHVICTLLAVVLAPLEGQAAEPMRQIRIYVQPYYEAARTPGESPRVAIGEQYNRELASNRREDVLAVRDRIAASPGVVTPMTMMVLAIRLYDIGERDEAVFWFYVAKARTVVLSEVLDMRQPGLAQIEDAVRNFSTLAGPAINGYAFCDLARQRDAHARAVAWVEAHPYEAMFMTQLPAKPGQRPENYQRGLALIKENAAKERAYFDNPQNVETFLNRRKANDIDIQFCWK